jgi:cobalt/nickel transport system permease protein
MFICVWMINQHLGKDYMHIMEGFLPSPWWEIWTAISIPLVAYGIYRLSKITKEHPEAKPLIALMGAFIFILSALKLPSVTGSSSHPTGAGLAAIIFGPAVASVLSVIVLVFQALLLAHGGLTTLGANTFSMGIVGPAIAFAVWIIGKKVRLSTSVTVFIAVALSDLGTYVATSAQLALAVPIAGNVFESFLAFGAIYAVTQIPLAIGEAILAVLLFDFLVKYKGKLLSSMKVIKFPALQTQEKGKPS